MFVNFLCRLPKKLDRGYFGEVHIVEGSEKPFCRLLGRALLSVYVLRKIADRISIIQVALGMSHWVNPMSTNLYTVYTKLYTVYTKLYTVYTKEPTVYTKKPIRGLVNR